MVAAVLLVNLNVFGLDDELPAVRHGIPRIQTEVHEHLLDLRGIHQRHAEIRGGHDADINLLSDHPSKQAHALDDKSVQISLTRLDHLSPCESEKLGGQQGSPKRLVLDLLTMVVQTTSRRRLFTAHFRPSQHYADHIVEIMRYATGELSN